MGRAGPGTCAEAMKRRSGAVGAGSGWCSTRGVGATIRFWYVGFERVVGVGSDTTRGGILAFSGGAGGGGSRRTTSTGTSARSGGWWASATTEDAAPSPSAWRPTESQSGQPASRSSIIAARTSGVRPPPQQVVIAAGQGDDAGAGRSRIAHLSDGHVEIEQQRALAVVAHHALHPEDGR